MGYMDLCKKCGHAEHDGALCVHVDTDWVNMVNHECTCDKIDYSIDCHFCNDSGFMRSQDAKRDPTNRPRTYKEPCGFLICECAIGKRIITQLISGADTGNR